MSLKFGSSEFNILPTGAQHTDGQYYLTAPDPSGAFRETQYSTAPATNFRKRIDHGFRDRRHGPFIIFFVAADEAALAAAIAAVKSNVSNTEGVTITYPSTKTYLKCFMLDGYPREIPDTRYENEVGTAWYCQMEYVLAQDGA
ncbi:MAG: hypothetical protein GY851_03420 [bacterium]|nr:hypothetical protein [bacterium]